jgi:hypothetical protein
MLNKSGAPGLDATHAVEARFRGRLEMEPATRERDHLVGTIVGTESVGIWCYIERGYATTRNPYCFLVAAVGFEPTTFGL